MDADGALVTNDWTPLALVLFGIALGALALLAAALWWAARLAWKLFGADAIEMLSERWRGWLSVTLRVAPPPLPPLDQNAAMRQAWVQQDQSQGLGRQTKDELS